MEEEYLTLHGETFDTDFLPCPRCGSHLVEWTSSRDQDVLWQSVQCGGCELSTFHVETTAFIHLETLDYETTLMKYNAWVKTNPSSYGDEKWKK